MTQLALWKNELYVQAATALAALFVLLGLLVYFLQSRSPKWIAVWASIKSWVFTAPFVFFAVALPEPWPLVLVTIISILGAKTFFRMTGMYHRSWFVWVTYVFLIAQAFLIYRDHDRFYNIMPMFFFAAVSLIPIFRNSSTHMIQYMALGLMNFIFMGWGFMYIGRILTWETGPLIVLYLWILSVLCETSNFVLTRVFGKNKPLQNITARFSIEGFFGSIFITLIIAWGLRSMLPDRSEPFWASAGLCVSIVGRLGGLILSVIRRDLGIKESGIFIIGRDDILSQIDKFIFAAPVFYFAFRVLSGSIEL